METRFNESKLKFAKGVMEGKNELTKEVMRKVRNDEDNKWNQEMKDYLMEIHNDEPIPTKHRYNTKINENQEP